MTAKEMFEKLGYKYYEDDIYFLKYYKTYKLSHDKEIKFHKADKTFTVKDYNGNINLSKNTTKTNGFEIEIELFSH